MTLILFTTHFEVLLHKHAYILRIYMPAFHDRPRPHGSEGPSTHFLRRKEGRQLSAPPAHRKTKNATQSNTLAGLLRSHLLQAPRQGLALFLRLLIGVAEPRAQKKLAHLLVRLIEVGIFYFLCTEAISHRRSRSGGQRCTGCGSISQRSTIAPASTVSPKLKSSQRKLQPFLQQYIALRTCISPYFEYEPF